MFPSGGILDEFQGSPEKTTGVLLSEPFLLLLTLTHNRGAVAPEAPEIQHSVTESASNVFLDDLSEWLLGFEILL